MTRECDVLYIHSTKKPNTLEQPSYAIMPMGIIGILNSLRAKGINVVGINLAIEKHLNPDYDITEVLQNMKYKVLLTDLHWYVHSYGAMYIVEQSKSVHPHIPTVIGGYTSTIYPMEIMENFSGVDYVVTGDSDLPMDMLIDYILKRSNIQIEDIPNLVYRQGSEIITAEKTWTESTLDNIDFIHTDFFDHKELVPYLTVNGVNKKHSALWLCLARGCKFNCSYCCGANVNMKTLFRRCNILKRNPEKVAKDFCELTAMGYEQVEPSHDFEMLGENYYREIFAKIRETNVEPGIYLELFQLPSKEYIDEIAATFNKKDSLMVISPISGNEDVRIENGKLFSNDDLYEMIEYIKSKELKILLYYTFNPVGETEAQFMDTIFQMQYLHLKYKFTKGSLLYQSIVVDPLAPMRAFDKIKVDYNCFMDYYNHCQLPVETKYTATGFDDGGEVSAERKMEAYNAIFDANLK